jgi:hypothetical protein
MIVLLRWLGGLLVMGIIVVSAYDHWTEMPSRLFEQLLGDSVLPRHKLEENIPSFLERGYSCDEILRTITEVRFFIRQQLLNVPKEEVSSVLVLRLAKEKNKRINEAEKHPDVWHGGLMWLKLKKSVFGDRSKRTSSCPQEIKQMNGGKK